MQKYSYFNLVTHIKVDKKVNLVGKTETLLNVLQTEQKYPAWVKTIPLSGLRSTQWNPPQDLEKVLCKRDKKYLRRVQRIRKCLAMSILVCYGDRSITTKKTITSVSSEWMASRQISRTGIIWDHRKHNMKENSVAQSTCLNTNIALRYYDLCEDCLFERTERECE